MMKQKTKMIKGMALVLGVGIFFAANIPFLSVMGQQQDENNGGNIVLAAPGYVNCFDVIRGGYLDRIACSIDVDGINYKCLLVKDVSSVTALSTCKPAEVPIGQ